MTRPSQAPAPAKPTVRRPPRHRPTARLEALYRAALDAAPEAFLAIDADDRIAAWSTRAEGLLGWRAAQAGGQPLGELLLAADDAAAHADALRRFRAGERNALAGPRRMQVRCRDGEVIPAELRLIALETGAGWHLAGFLRDLTDDLLAERQVIQAQKLEAINHLASGMAHDFNNILGIIIGSLDLVRPALPAGQDRELVDAALAAAHRGTDVTRALLRLAGRRALHAERCNVNELIEEMAPLLKQTAGPAIALDIVAAADPAASRIDRGAFGNALVNLVINARDAMPSGGRMLVYAYAINLLPHSLMAPLELAPGPYLVIGVDDTGSGMPPEVAACAFDPFFTTKERGQGTGLGLAMIYGFARQSGGTATIRSAPGEGTSVQMLIPVADGD